MLWANKEVRRRRRESQVPPDLAADAPDRKATQRPRGPREAGARSVLLPPRPAHASRAAGPSPARARTTGCTLVSRSLQPPADDDVPAPTLGRRQACRPQRAAPNALSGAESILASPQDPSASDDPEL